MKGVAKVKGTVKILLDLDRVLGHRRRGAARRLGCRRWAPLRATFRERCGCRDAISRGSSGSSTSEPASRCTRASGRSCSARLQKRLRAWRVHQLPRLPRSTSRRDQSGAELTALLDAIATNHTSFFREPQHFEFLQTTRACRRSVAGQRLRVWSAACSTGEEPVTIAITLLDALPRRTISARIRLLASDLSTKALAIAAAGVYKMERVAGMPLDDAAAPLRARPRRADGAGAGRAARAAAHRVPAAQFARDRPTSSERFDVIFCRNVMIYFDRDVQQRVVSLLERHLAPGGYLFISHSESLNGTRTA